MTRQGSDSRASSLESAVGRTAGPFVILVALLAGCIVLLDASIPLLFLAGIESFLVGIGALGLLLARFFRSGILYARISELNSRDRRLISIPAIPIFLSAGFFAASSLDVELLMPIEVGTLATGILLISAGLRKQSGNRNYP